MSEYIKKYPWLRLRNLYDGQIDENYDAMDEMPDGWKIAFGDMIVEELDEEIRKAHLEDEFVVEQCKEKYGSLRFYVNAANEEIWDIINKYETLSEHICIDCGKPDVPMLNLSWIQPLCKDCFQKRSYSTSKTYEELSSNEKEMPNELVLSCYKHGENYTRTINIQPTANKIRELFLQRKKD